MTRPPYEALDEHGEPYVRPARCVGELPVDQRGQALTSATQEVARLMRAPAQRCIPFGAPVYVAFGLTRVQASQHALSQLLLTKGDSLSLDYCPEYSVDGPAAGVDLNARVMTVRQAAQWAESKGCIYRTRNGQPDWMAAAVDVNTLRVLSIGFGDTAYAFARVHAHLPLRVYTLDEVIQGMIEEDGEAACVPGPRDCDGP